MLAQVQRVFDAAHEDVMQDVHRFARERNTNQNPFGAKRYVVSQQHYIQYCCHATVRMMLENVTDGAETTAGQPVALNR